MLLCPVCHKKFEIDDSKFTCKYPQTFFDFGDGVDIDNETINKEIRRMIQSLIEANEPNDYRIFATGNTYVVVFRHDYDENYYEVVVTKNYQSMEINFDDAYQMMI